MRPLRLARAAVLLLLLPLGGCGPGVRSDPAPWLARPGRCLLTRDLSEHMESMARRCAEAFVRQNGYTEVRPSEDPLYWVAEPHERGRWQEILAARQGTLDERAESVICVRRECRVFFRTRGRPDECLLRAVTMNRVFADLHLLPGAVPSARCSRRA